MQRCIIYLYLETALYVFGWYLSTHHQEHAQLYLQHLVLVKPLLLPAGTVEELERSSNSSTLVCAPDDGWTYHPKHVEQFPDINKLCNVASCWIYILEYPRRTFDSQTDGIPNEAFLVCFEELSEHLPGRTEEYQTEK